MTASPLLSAECRLVYGAASPAPDLAAMRALLGEPLDWARVIVIAEQEKATAVLWRVIERSAGEPPGGMGNPSRGDVPAIPAEAAARLRRAAMVHDFRMLRLASRLEATVRAIAARGVPVLLLKGAALANQAYGSFVARPMTDVDLLVRREDVPRAREAIVETGWMPSTDPALIALLRDGHHEPEFLDPEPTGLRVELHTQPLPTDQPFGLTGEVLWEDARPARAPLQGAHVPSPSMLLVHACVHFAWAHVMQFGAWRTIRDAHVLTRDGAMDWDRFVATAHRLKAGSCCYWTLRLAQRLSGLPVPAAVLAALAPPTPEFARRALERHFVALAAPGEGPPCPSLKVARALWLAALRPRWSGHRAPGRHDPDRKWQQVRGHATEETVPSRVVRHATGFRRWWGFAWRTLLASRTGGAPPA